MQVESWPAESCDMMPIEQLFSDMKQFLKNVKQPKNLKELTEGVQEFVREHLSVEKCRRFIRHMRKSMDLVVKRNGAAVRGKGDDRPNDNETV